MIKEWKQIHITCYKYQLMDAGKAEHSLSRVASQFSNTIHFKELFSNRIKLYIRHNENAINLLQTLELLPVLTCIKHCTIYEL